MRRTVISLFAGCGGSSLGYHQAGFEEKLAVDFDDHSEEVFTLNFPEVPFLNMDVRHLEADGVMKITGLKEGQLDILDGSPPCQGFSTAGDRKVRDHRNDLFLEYFRLVDHLQPKVFVMENVPGMTKGPMKGKFNQVMWRAQETGYSVKCFQLDASYYGVPQVRKRLFFVGYQKDLFGVSPTPPTPDPVPRATRPYLTIEKSPPEEIEEAYDKAKGKMTKQLLRSTLPGHSLSDHHPKGHWFTQIRASYDLPCPTILKSNSLIFHPSEDRALTRTELKAMCGFPNDFKLPGSYEQCKARLGNSVMPPLMQRLASHIRKEAFGDV